MRNLKKLFAVVMVVAMLASIMVPALAADVQYETEAEMLKDLGLFLGTNNGFELEAELTREQALALMIRVMGLEEEVKAMTQPEVAEQMAKVVDPETVTDWAKPYVAYAIKNGLTDGIDAKIKPNVKFAGQLTITGKEFINFMLKGMGYDMTGKWDDVLTFAAETGMISAGDAVKFGSITVMKRDFAVAIMASALNGMTANGVTLAQYLVDQGAVSEDKMVEYGFITPTVAPTEAPVELTVEADADNLIQVYLVYSAAVDKDSAEKVENYELKGADIKSAQLQDDGVTVVLTLDLESDGMEQQAVADLTVKNVKDLDGNVIEKTTLEVEFLDRDIPEVVDAEVVGNNTFKVTFSEPMKVVKKDQFVVNKGKMYVKNITMQNNNTEALVEMYSTLKEGEVTLQVKSGNEDYAGFGVVGKIFTLEVVPDEEAPVVVGYESAKRNKVTLIWNEDIKINFTLNADGELVDAEDLENFYHTNSKNPATKVTKDGKKLTLEFGDDEDNWLPAGTAYVYVLKDSVKDYWDNKNAQQMIKVEVEVDETAPEVDEIKVLDEDKIEVKFTEDLDGDTAEDHDNYTLLDDKGKEVKNIIRDIDYDSKKVTITFYEDLNGDYTLVIEDVEDIFGNAMPETAVAFTVGDETDPDPEDFSAVLYNAGEVNQMIKINFGEKMALDGKYAVNDDEKYVINDKALTEYDDYEIEVVEDGKVVEIYIPAKDKNGKAINGTIELDPDADEIRMLRVADAAGNYTGALSFTINLVAEGSISFAQKEGKYIVEATAKDTIKIKFDDNVVKFNVEDLLISELADKEDAVADASVKNSVYKIDIAGVDTELDGGKTVVYLKTGKNLPFYIDENEPSVFVHVVGDKSENAYGEKIKDTTVAVRDKIKPEVANAKKDKDIVFSGNTITIKYTEELDAEREDLFALDLIITARDGSTLVALDDYETEVVDGNTIKVTVTKDDVEDLDKYTIECKDKVERIKDLNGNVAKSFGKVKN